LRASAISSGANPPCRHPAADDRDQLRVGRIIEAQSAIRHSMRRNTLYCAP
jgi:hypothetical protein